MKHPSSSLFFLIKSLGKSEKRYLKLGLTTKQTVHLKLFDAIIAQEVYDEERLKSENADALFVKNLPVYKTYLYNYILTRLSQYHNNSESARILEKLRFAEVLSSKKLFDQAQKQLKSARKLSIRFHQDEVMPLIVKAEADLLRQKNKSDFKGLLQLNREKKEVLDSLQAINEYEQLFNEISDLQVKIQKAGSEAEKAALETWRQNPLLNVPVEYLPMQNRIVLLKSMAIYHFTKGAVKAASGFNKKILDLMDAEPDYTAKHPELYLSTLNNFIIDQLSLKNITAFEGGLQRLEQLPENPAFRSVENIGARMFYQRYLLMFNHYFSAKAFGKAMTQMPDFKNGFQQFDNQLRQHQKLTLNYLAGVLCFGAKKYEAAQNWIFPILQETKEDVVKEIFRYARLLNLLVHLELGHFQYLESLILSTQRSLTKQSVLGKSEKLVIQFLKKNISAATEKERRELKEELFAHLDELRALPEEQRLFNYIPVMVWLQEG